MTEIVNLRIARKRKARDLKEKTAEENRLRHGLPGAERDVARARRERELTVLEAHRIQRPEPEKGS